MPRKTWQEWRWVALALSCLVLLGPYAAFDNPAASNPQLRELMQDKGLSPSTTFDETYALLYTVYSIPNTVLPLLGVSLTQRRTRDAPAADREASTVPRCRASPRVPRRAS